MILFLDNASTTKTFKEVNEEINNCFINDFYNPGALYNQGFIIKNKLEEKREYLKSLVGANGYKVIFTASATEADNLALFQVKKNTKIIISGGEHPAIYETANSLKNQGIEVVIIPLLANGRIDEVEFKRQMTKEVSFVSIMHVSNETGAINSIKELCSFAKMVNPNVIFHSDGVQAFMKIDTNLSYLGVDMYTVSSHKIHGPKGVGVLFVKDCINIKPQILGGGQENGKRSGTENYPLISGFVKAVEILSPTISSRFEKVLKSKKLLIKAFNKSNIEWKLNGDEDKDSPYILSASFLGVRGEVLLHMLEEYDILVSTGSACSTKKIGNRILQNMGKSQLEIEGNIRFSFDAFEDIDIDYLAEKVCECVKKYKRIR